MINALVIEGSLVTTPGSVSVPAPVRTRPPISVRSLMDSIISVEVDQARNVHSHVAFGLPVCEPHDFVSFESAAAIANH